MAPFEQWLAPARLRARIYEAALAHGRLPSLAELAAAEAAAPAAVRETLALLAERHHVVVQPDGELVAAHPFSGVPTPFVVRVGEMTAWGFCIWDALGIAAMAGRDARIDTHCASCFRRIALTVGDGRLGGDRDVIAQFLVPAQHFWDDVVFTCATQLPFCDEAHAATWRARFGRAPGQLLPIERVWELARVWYGEDRRQRHWRRRTVGEANAIFAALGLPAPFWRLEAGATTHASDAADAGAGRQVRVFVGADGGGGNRTVVFDGDGDEARLRAAAARIGSESTAIVRDGDAATPPRLRFFLPTGEMAFCGHGTLGAAALLAGGGARALEVIVGPTRYALEVSDRDGPFAELLAAPGRAAPVAPADAAWAWAALGLDPADRPQGADGAAWPVVRAGNERPKTLVPVASVAALDALVTSEARVAAACAALGTTGLYPFVVLAGGGDGQAEIAARQFPAGAGFLEDAATGVAALALATAWRDVYRDQRTALRIQQGMAMSMPCELFVRWRPDGRLALGGRVRW